MIVSGAKALIRGDVSAVKQQAANVAQSAQRDLRKAYLAASHARLKR